MPDRSSDSLDSEPLSESVDIGEIRDRLPDAIAQHLPEKITRRQAVIGAAGLTLGTVLVADSDNQEAFDQTEAQFSDLAVTIDGTDLRNPRHATELKSAVTETLDDVESVLGPAPNREGEAADTSEGDRLNTSTATSQSPNGQAPLKSAQRYYTRLESVLAQAVSIYESLRAVEPVILYNTDETPSDPLKGIQPGRLNSSIESLLATNEQSVGESPPESPELFPDRSAVATQLRDLTRVYRLLIAAQHSTFASGTTVVVATEHHERGEFEKAQSAFTTAHEQTDVQVPTQFTQYDIHDAGLTLGQYNRLLSTRREGIESLLRASAPEIDRETRGAAFNKGLEKLLQARAILTENSYPPVF
jgi:hypothetical protein